MGHLDTIVAAATPPGRGGIGIVRISGAKAPQIGAAILGELPPASQARACRFRDAQGATLDEGIALFFAAPRSFTGEHVVELQGHGGAVVIESLIARALELGARRAHPGEFTQRAFLNDKLDLVQAEAVADLIDAGSREAARAALRSLQGEFSAMVRGLADALLDLRTYVEAAIDFPEEEIDFLADTALGQRMKQVAAHLDAVELSARRGRLLTQGMTVVIAGRPNAGKSALLNRLAGHDAAIVTPIAGTTRDVLRERIHLDGMPLHLIDTAGLREDEQSADPIEQEGMRRARAEIARADRLLFVIDVSDDPAGDAFEAERDLLPPALAADSAVTLVFNKSDLLDSASHAGRRHAAAALQRRAAGAPPRFLISAVTGAGVADLRHHLKNVMGYNPADGGQVSARARHLEALARTRFHVDAARGLLEQRSGELVAEELRLGQLALGEITGEVTSDDLLGSIFGSFCIGK